MKNLGLSALIAAPVAFLAYIAGLGFFAPILWVFLAIGTGMFLESRRDKRLQGELGESIKFEQSVNERRAKQYADRILSDEREKRERQIQANLDSEKAEVEHVHSREQFRRSLREWRLECDHNTSVVGEDRELHWIQSEVAIVLKKKELAHQKLEELISGSKVFLDQDWAIANTRQHIANLQSYLNQLAKAEKRIAAEEDWNKFRKWQSECDHNTSVVGEDRELHWIQSEVAIVLKKKELAHQKLEELISGSKVFLDQHHAKSSISRIIKGLESYTHLLREASLSRQFAVWTRGHRAFLLAKDMRLHVDSKHLADFWLESRRRPEPQPFGVSHEGAEHLVAAWLEYLGETNVAVTKFSRDGGIDVLTDNLVCQVKNYGSSAVSASEVRDLFGVASSEGKVAALFTSSKLSGDAVEFCEKTGVVAISYDAETATLTALNSPGREYLMLGQY